MAANKQIKKEIEAQRRIISRLKREIFGVDKTGKSRYIKDFQSAFGSFRGIVPVAKVIERAVSADVVYFGDYHPLDASQEWVLRLMREFSERGRDVVLALEMLYTHQQEFLDRWMKGKISEEDFLEAISYTSEWGFRWESYRRIFELAKDPFMPIFGVDSAPRDHLRYIKMRDRMVARRIKTIRNFFPGRLLLVVIGESHLAPGHLPAGVRRACRDGYKEITIVQNMDEIYWKLLRKGRADAEAVHVGDSRYCIFTASPILKYQSYREILDIWIEGEEVDRHTPELQDMVDSILIFLIGDPGNLNVTGDGGLKEPLEDVFPEVHCRKTYHAFSSYLRSRRISNKGVIAALENLKYFKVSYIPAINEFLIMRFDPVQAAREAARFVYFALRDMVGRRKKRLRTAGDRFYAFVLEEALVYFGSKIIDPTQNYVDKGSVLSVIGTGGSVRGTIRRHSKSETREIVRLVKYHFRRERMSKGTLRATKKLRDIHNLCMRKRLFVVKTLGHTLGEAIYSNFHKGIVSREDILELFAADFGKRGSAKAAYISWVKKTGPFRGGWG